MFSRPILCSTIDFDFDLVDFRYDLGVLSFATRGPWWGSVLLFAFCALSFSLLRDGQNKLLRCNLASSGGFGKNRKGKSLTSKDLQLSREFQIFAPQPWHIDPKQTKELVLYGYLQAGQVELS